MFYNICMISSQSEYALTMKSMKEVGFEDSEIAEVKRTLCAILWLGQVQFSETEDEKSKLVDSAPVKIIAGGICG